VQLRQQPPPFRLLLLVPPGLLALQPPLALARVLLLLAGLLGPLLSPQVRRGLLVMALLLLALVYL
jgi:hypothetical protein